MMNREELINKLLSYSEYDINYENDLYELIELIGGSCSRLWELSKHSSNQLR